MSIREDMEELERKTEELQKQTLAMEIYSDYKKTNIRLFWIWIITFITLIGVTCYTIYLLNDISTVEATENNQEITDIDTIDGNVVNGGDIYGES